MQRYSLNRQATHRPHPRVLAEWPNGTLAYDALHEPPRVVRFDTLARHMQRDETLLRALRVPGTALVGLDQEDIPLLLRLSSPDVTHCLIAGATASGKTELLRTIVQSVVQFQKPRDVRLALFDLRAHRFAPFADVPHLLFPLVSQPTEMVIRLQELVRQMEQRVRDGFDRPRILVVVDEIAEALRVSEETSTLITRLAERGRRAGISLVVSTQKPSAPIVDVLEATLPLRIVGRVTSPDEARTATGAGGSGAERLLGRGDFLMLGGGEHIRFQAAYCQLTTNILYFPFVTRD